MASVETALVSASGRLLIELDNGTIIDAGYVRGGQGPAGQDGADGSPGIPGAKGDAGTNGAQWHTGVGAPEISVGANGDMYMDVASAMLPIYQKVNGDWLFLANLKATPVGSGGGGGGGAAGGGGSVILYPKPDGGAPPLTDNDGKPIDRGDIWLDTNTGFLWVYNGTNWVPVGDRPPVIISPDPPVFNNASDTNTQYPITEGDLWFDSDQAALYVAAEDAAGDLVWVISTPADRSILQDEIPVGGFIFPAATQDGDTVFNDTTGLWYVYNGKKRQWIDLPAGNQELSLQAILLRGADNFPTTFEYEPADRVTYDTEALCYVNADDHPGFTRIVVPFVDTAGFDWTFLLRGIRKGDQLSLVQIDTVDPLDPDDDFPFRSDYLTISDITENAESINIDLEYQQENPVHLPLFGEPVAIRFKAIINVGEYVLKSGDTMTGPLVMDDAGEIEMRDTNLDFIRTGESLKDINGDPILEDDGLGNMVEQWDDSIDRFSHIESLPPRIIRSNGTYGADTSAPFGIRVEIDDGNTHRNRFVVGNRNGDAVTVTGGTGPNVQFGSGFSGNNDKVAPGEEGKVRIKGIATPDFETADYDFAVNKGYVDARDELLRQDIIELEEEIDAIAPSLEYGTWEWEQPTSNLRAPEKGKFYLLDGSNQLTTEYKDTKIIVINNYEYDDPSDSDPVDIHTWADANPGELIQLFDAADPDFMLGKIVAVNPDFETGSSGTLEFVRIEIDLIQSSGVPNDNPDPVTGKFLTRVNVFKEPSGGTASDFVLKNGDTMSGELEFYKEQDGSSVNFNVPSVNTQDIRFTTKNTDGGADSTVQLYQPGYSNIVVSSGSLMARSALYTGSYLYATSFNSDGSRSTKNPRLYFTSTEGALRYGTSTNVLTWDSTKVVIPKTASTNTSRSGFTIKGATSTGYGSTVANQDGDLLKVEHVGTYADRVQYFGRIAANNDIATKKYVDDKSGASNYVKTDSAGWNGNMTITKSNGNYYITGG